MEEILSDKEWNSKTLWAMLGLILKDIYVQNISVNLKFMSLNRISSIIQIQISKTTRRT
jgi:hypothetical protein